LEEIFRKRLLRKSIGVRHVFVLGKDEGENLETAFCGKREE
jgi:hypothetical protein